jgi:predicted amidophosphoribosyltransferase
MPYIDLIIGSSYITKPFHRSDWLTSTEFLKIFTDKGHTEYDTKEHMADTFEFTRDLIYSLKGDTKTPWGSARTYGSSYNYNDEFKYTITGAFCQDSYLFLEEMLIFNSLSPYLEKDIEYVIIPIPGSKCTTEKGLSVESPTVRIANSIKNVLDDELVSEIMTPLTWKSPQESLRNGAKRDYAQRLAALDFDVGSLPALTGKCIILFDDVVTGGHTMRASYAKLRQHGIRNIKCYTIARPMKLGYESMSPLWPEPEKFFVYN